MKRKIYTAQFKAKIGLEAIRGIQTVNEIRLAYGVHPVQVNLWKKEIQVQAGLLFETKGYANGFKPKTVRTRLGALALSVPQTRDSQFYPKSLEKGLRS
ncbi:MAG: transposase, partial [Gammaproteobacteria bacterium]|nr:transposase [Gammaproteobacteria bacterium]